MPSPRAKEVFLEALARPAEERTAVLLRACAGNATLRAQVDDLLKMHEEAGRFMSRPTSSTCAAPLPTHSPVSVKPGTIIDRYKLLQQIGEGGFGVVYMAEQQEPVRRMVALKIIKLGMDTRQTLARFDAERQALAMMEHPNIASILDAGATDTGRPYFVMELVKGVPITHYCDRERIALPDRLSLFLSVCGAVQHAHQKGIIHRDIKPSNILVTLHDGKPVPKVIDFGIAKATEQKLTDRTMFTEYGQFMGTPSYMSPEQAEMSGLDIDTRSDIYSLGVLLYELLTSSLPFDPERLSSAGRAEMVRIIKDEEPHRPSTRLRTLAAETEVITGRSSAAVPIDQTVSVRRTSLIADIARMRHTDPQTLVRTLRGDLDWIVMKCLEKDRTRRYATANGLARDVDRFLAGETVSAVPPSGVYQLRKFARRNRGLVTAGALCFVLLVGGIIATGWQAVNASRQRDRAITAEQQQNTERQRAEAARDEAEAVTRFLSNMLASVDPGNEGKDVTVRAILDQSSQRVSAQFADKPLVQARLLETIAMTYIGLGLFETALKPAVEASEVASRNLGDQAPQTLKAWRTQSYALLELGRFAEAETLLRKVWEGHRQRSGPESDHALIAMQNLAIVMYNRGHHDQVESMMREALAGCRRVLGDDHPTTISVLFNLGNAYGVQGRHAEAEGCFREVLEKRRKLLGEEHPHTLGCMKDLAKAVNSQGRFQEAELLHRQTLALQRKVLGNDHPDLLHTQHELACVLVALDRSDEARGLLEETVERRRALLGSDHPLTLASQAELGSMYLVQNRLTAAETLFRETLDAQRRLQGEDHPDTARTLELYAWLLVRTNRYADADALSKQAETIWSSRLPAEHRTRREILYLRGVILSAQGKFKEAESLFNVSAMHLVDSTVSSSLRARRQVAESMVRHYEAWEAAEPGLGHAEHATTWRRLIEEQLAGKIAESQLNGAASVVP